MTHYTITFNPAVDLVMNVDDLQVGGLNRSQKEDYVPGGKGINMSTILHRLGEDTVATGFAGGFSGQYIIDQLHAEGVPAHFISVAGVTRINAKVKGKTETEINGAGPTVSAKDLHSLLNYFDKQLTAEDVIFLAGNTAPGLGIEAYETIAALAQKKQAKLIVDSNTDYLAACLKFSPFMIKPNEHELGELFGVELHGLEEIIHYARLAQKQGAQNVLVSRGGDGALLLTEEGQLFTSDTPAGTLINSTGAGDSMLAGFVAAYAQTGDYAKSLQQAAAAGSATAFSVGIATTEAIETLIPQINVKQIN